MTPLQQNPLIAWAGFAIALVGVLTHPTLLAVLPDWASVTLSTAGAIIQAVSKSLLEKKDAEEDSEG